jgi:transcriptional regulator with XRE-family HTH domain
MTLTALKEKRLRKAWSQERLAEIAGVSTRTIQRLEAGNKCSPETAQAIASSLDLLSPAELSHESSVEAIVETKTPQVDNNTEQTCITETNQPEEDLKSICNISKTATGILPFVIAGQLIFKVSADIISTTFFAWIVFAVFFAAYKILPNKSYSPLVSLIALVGFISLGPIKKIDEKLLSHIFDEKVPYLALNRIKDINNFIRENEAVRFDDFDVDAAMIAQGYVSFKNGPIEDLINHLKHKEKRWLMDAYENSTEDGIVTPTEFTEDLTTFINVAIYHNRELIKEKMDFIKKVIDESNNSDYDQHDIDTLLIEKGRTMGPIADLFATIADPELTLFYTELLTKSVITADVFEDEITDRVNFHLRYLNTP